MRALWKGYFTFPFKEDINAKIVLIYSRAAVITSTYVGKRVAIYNGVKFVSIIIRPLMVGSKFGELAPTKKIGAAIHKEGRLAKKKK